MDSSYYKLNYNKRISFVCIFVIFIYFLVTMRCWIGFGGRKQIIEYVFPLLMLLFSFIGKVRFVFKKRYFLFTAIVAIVSLLNIRTRQNIFGIIGQIIPAFNIFLVLSIPDQDKEFVLIKLVKWFGILMMMSIPIYILNLLVALPNLQIITADYGSVNVIAGYFSNYIFYIKPLHLFESGVSFLRFNGPFIEPGDIGCVASFILMATRFDFSRYKYLWVVFVSVLLSFSLAGYLLTLSAYLFKALYERKKRRKTIISLLIIVFSFYFFGILYNGGDNFLNEAILSRLQADEDTGFTGNNRTSMLKTEYFFNMFKDPHIFLFGYDKNTLDMLYETGVGSGFINQAIVVGMLGMFGLILPYFYFFYTSKSRKYALYFFLFFLLFLFQRTDTLWITYILAYVYGIVISETDKKVIHYE